MAPDIVPFAPGPPRRKEVISLGFYRTGSQSLKEALTILGYRDVFHSSSLGEDLDKWSALSTISDDNIACLPSYTGREYTNREEWDAFFGPCEALTDVTPYAASLLKVYPEAKVILVHREFAAWRKSFLETLVLPSSDSWLAWLSGNLLEPIARVPVTRSAWKMYMGLLGVSRLEKTRDEAVARAGYRRHYDAVRSMVPQENLLELDLQDLAWEPLCKFLGKDVPQNVPFPRVNESKVFRNEFKKLHRMVLTGVLLRLVLPTSILLGAIWLGLQRL